MKISVALAAYKGEKYIAEQLLSVLPQLGEQDEIIVSDDYPEGLTRQAVLEIGDPRIIYTEGPGKGVISNFESALSKCTGDVIFLCDQDDVWMDNKVEEVMKRFRSGAAVVVHDASVTDSALNVTEKSNFSLRAADTRFLPTLLRNTIPGCCMAFDRRVLSACLPFPEGIPMHDWYIYLVALKKKLPVSVIGEPLILWRRHGDNVTGRRTSLKEKTAFRFNLIKALR